MKRKGINIYYIIVALLLCVGAYLNAGVPLPENECTDGAKDKVCALTTLQGEASVYRCFYKENCTEDQTCKKNLLVTVGC